MKYWRFIAIGICFVGEAIATVASYRLGDYLAVGAWSCSLLTTLMAFWLCWEKEFTS